MTVSIVGLDAAHAGAGLSFGTIVVIERTAVGGGYLQTGDADHPASELLLELSAHEAGIEVEGVADSDGTGFDGSSGIGDDFDRDVLLIIALLGFHDHLSLTDLIANYLAVDDSGNKAVIGFILVAATGRRSIKFGDRQVLPLILHDFDECGIHNDPADLDLDLHALVYPGPLAYIGDHIDFARLLTDDTDSVPRAVQADDITGSALLFVPLIIGIGEFPFDFCIRRSGSNRDIPAAGRALFDHDLICIRSDLFDCQRLCGRSSDGHGTAGADC